MGAQGSRCRMPALKNSFGMVGKARIAMVMLAAPSSYGKRRWRRRGRQAAHAARHHAIAHGVEITGTLDRARHICSPEFNARPVCGGAYELDTAWRRFAEASGGHAADSRRDYDDELVSLRATSAARMPSKSAPVVILPMPGRFPQA